MKCTLQKKIPNLIHQITEDGKKKEIYYLYQHFEFI